VGEEFEARGSLGAQPSAGDGRFRIALDGNQLALFVENLFVRSRRRNRGKPNEQLERLHFRTQVSRPLAKSLQTGSVTAMQNLLNERPTKGGSPTPAPLLRLADVYLTCSAQDGLPNAVLEAMASGLPVVAAPAGGITELVDEQTGIVLASPSAEELAHAATALLSDDGRRRRLGQAARRRVVQRYSLAMTADRLAELYRRVGA